MKTKNLLLSTALCFSSLFMNAQLKVFSDGTVAIGGTTSVPWSVNIAMVGNTLFTQTQSSATSSAYIRGLNAFSSATNPDYTWFGNDQTGFFHPASNILGFTCGGTERMRIGSTGKLFIGTTTDYSSWINVYAGNNRAIYCEVNHSVDYMQGIVTKLNRANGVTYVVNYGGTDNFYVKGDGTACSARAFYNWSDASFKENITTIPHALDKVLGMRGVYYNFKSTAETGSDLHPREMGLIAQETEKVAPEVVMTMPNGNKALAYGPLVGLLVEAIKEQNDSIRELRNTLNQCCNATNYNANATNGNPANIDAAIAANPNRNYLFQNTPNPFSQKTTISYFIAGETVGNAQILVFDMQGLLKKTYPINEAGKATLDISASEFPAGMYLYTLMVNNVEVDTKKMILTR